MVLLEESVIVLLDYAKTFPVYERKKYTKIFQEFNTVFQACKAK